jgi:hypothetical protein
MVAPLIKADTVENKNYWQPRYYEDFGIKKGNITQEIIVESRGNKGKNY